MYHTIYIDFNKLDMLKERVIKIQKMLPWKKVHDHREEKCPSDDQISLTRASGLLQKASRVFTNRKLVLLVITHVVVTAVVFAHYGMTKYHVRSETLSLDEMNRTLKIIAPTIAYGTKHMIHFQLCMLPLTMCRYSIAQLSQTNLFRFFPFEDMTQYHIWVGYALVSFVVLAFSAFMFYYGIACGSGEKSFCEGFSSEIMLTGYLLFILFVTVGVTSFYRFHIPYKWFYNIHQIVFVAFFFAIIHTIDRIQRSQGGRSQVFVWVSASLVLYLSDRATLHTKGKYTTTIEGYHAVNSLKERGPTEEDHGVIVLKLKKPRSFHFVAGHHAKLRMKEIDPTWHPFTIASSPDSDLLEFYIKVNATGTWTYNLLDVIRQKHSTIGVSEKIVIEVMGPFGTPIPYSSNYSDALLFGSGTGFVPSLSILQQHVEKCLKLDPSSYKLQKERKQERLENLRESESRPEPEKLAGSVQIASSQEREKQAKAAKRKIYKHLASFVGFITGLISLSLTLSWNNLPYEVSSNMTYVLIFTTAFFEVLYLILIVTKQEIPSMEFFLVFFVFVATLIGDWYWMVNKGMNTLTSTAQVLYSVLMLYILSRFWKEICKEIRENPMLSTNKDQTDFNIYDSVTFIWIERSADIVQNILPVFCDLWEKLEVAWGNEMANETFKFQIFCTDRNEASCEKLLELAQNSSLSSMDGNIFVFKRPSFPAVLERHSLELNSTKDISSTIIAFCGSSMVGGMIKDAYVMNEIWKASIGLLGHHAELQVHSYGGLSTKKKAKHIRKQNEASESISVPSNLYWESSFAQKISRDQLPHPTCSMDGNIRKERSNRKIHTPTLDAMRSRKRNMEQKYGSETDSTISKDNKRSALLLFSGREGSKDTMETKQETATAAEVNDIILSPLAKRYNIGEQIGAGASATVYKITLKGSSTSFAAKIFRKSGMTKKQRDEVEREILIMRELRHPNIITLHDTFTSTNLLSIVMDLAPNGDVFDRLMKSTSYSELDAQSTIEALLGAIHHCHEKRIAHRDLKPDNLLLVQDSKDNHWNIMLADFGFAKKAQNEKCLVTQCGSPLFVSPEILHGTPYGTKTDLWSIGVITYILLCGFPPFTGSSSKDLFRSIKRGKFSFRGDQWEMITSEGKDFISSLLVCDPQDRCDAALAMEHPWLSLQPDRFADLSSSLLKLKTFNAKRKVRQAVFSLIAANKITSLGVRFNSDNANDEN